MRSFIAYIFILSLGLASCGNDVLVSEKWEWKDQQWVAGDIKNMELEASDTTALYAMDLDLTWNTDYPFQNCYIRTTTVFPSGKEVQSVVSMEMAEKDGTWAGNCNSKVCKLQYPLQKKFTFPEPGTYKWSVEPFMRVDTVAGIEALKVTCRKLKK